jgi:hypothetical protein
MKFEFLVVVITPKEKMSWGKHITISGVLE